MLTMFSLTVLSTLSCSVYHVVDVVKCFVVYNILLTLGSHQTFSQSKRYINFMTKKTNNFALSTTCYR